LALALLAGIAGCGGDGGESDLASYMPSDSPLLTQVDMAEVREQLGLPDDADALDFAPVIDGQVDPASPEYDLLSASLIAAPELSIALQTFEVDPVAEAFDGTAITATANAGGGPESLTAIATDQSLDDLEEALADEGYERDGDALVNPDPDGRAVEIADTGDGVLLLSGEEGAAVDAAADPPGGPAELIEMLESAEQPIAQGVTTLGEDCVTAFGGWENAQLDEGAIKITLDRDAEADSLDLGDLEDADSISIGEATVDGNSVEVPFTVDSDQPLSVIRSLISRFGAGLYSC
jgi:hypothetical protein